MLMQCPADIKRFNWSYLVPCVLLARNTRSSTRREKW